MRLVTWNIRAGGGANAAAIAGVVQALDADVAVLTETTATRTPALADALRRGGWPDVHATAPPPREYGALIASRTASRRLPLEDGPAPHRALGVEVHGLAVLGCYMPLPATGGRGSTLQVDVWRWLLGTLASHESLPAVVLGDFNTCTAADGAGKDLPCADRLRELGRRGWKSAFRLVHPEARAASWWHHTGTGFRIDDAYVSPAFAGLVSTAEYVTSVSGLTLAWNRRGPRPESVLSDHAALMVETHAA